MYWADSNSNIDTLLSKETVTLEEILNEDDVLQECIANNQSLIAFLSDDNQMMKMLSFIVDGPPECSNEMERYKYANTICEILTFDGNVFADLIVQNEKYISILWSFVEQKEVHESESNDNSDSTSQSIQLTIAVDRPLNPLLASFFTKILLYLFTHKIDCVLDFLSSKKPPNDLVSVILRHINTSAIMDFVYKSWEYINIYDKISSENAEKFNDLLLKNGFIEKLIEVFKETNCDSKQQNAANLISDLVRIGRELLANNSKTKVDGILEQFEASDVAKILLQNMFESQTKNSIVSGLKLIQDLLVYRIQVQNLISQQQEHLSSLAADIKKSDTGEDPDSEGMPTFLKNNTMANTNGPNDMQFMAPQLASPVGVYGEHLSRCIRNVCSALREKLDDFVGLLLNPTFNVGPIATTAGIIAQPLGLIRLEVIHLFVALFATSDYSILEKCSQINVLKLLTDLFFQYSLNNQLHKYYEQIIGYIFQNYSNFKNIYDKHNKNNNVQTPTGESVDEANAAAATAVTTSTSNAKISQFIKLYEISRILVKQILEDCHLVEKILDNYSQEDVPVRSSNIKKDDSSISNDTAAIKANDDVEIKMGEDVPPPLPSSSPPTDTTDQTEIKTEDTVIKTEDTEIKTEDAVIKSEDTVIKSEDTVIKTEDAVIKSEDTVIKTEDTESNEEANKTIVDNLSNMTNAEELNGTTTITADQIDQDLSNTNPNKTRLLRPGYMGHLRLIANILKDRCTEELLDDCNLDSEVRGQWDEFKSGKLAQFNDLVNSKLVEESKMNEANEQEIFYKYQTESLAPNLPSNIELLPNDFGQNSLGDINQKLKLSVDFEFDKYWTLPQNQKLYDLEKIFDEKCSSLFDDDEDDDDAFGLGNSSQTTNILNNKNKERPSLLTNIINEDFVNEFDPKDPFSCNDSIDDFVENFANFDPVESNQWSDGQVITGSATSAAGPSAGSGGGVVLGPIVASTPPPIQQPTAISSGDNWANMDAFFSDPFENDSIDNDGNEFVNLTPSSSSSPKQE